MGQQHSNLSHLPGVDYQPECTVLEKTHDAHYGEIKIVREIKSAEKMILKEIILNSKETFETEAGPFIKKLKSRHPNIIEILGFSFKEKHKFCSSYYKISVYIEDISQTLFHQLESRRATGVSFTDNEILFIAHSLLSGLSHFESQGLYHGDVRPFNVFCKERAYKLSDPALNAQKGSTALSFAIFHNTQTLLAPELLAQVPQRRFDISCDPHKADVFSLGATLLALATLLDSEDFYDLHQGAIKAQILSDRLDTVRLTYSEFTYEFIKDMLTMNPIQRPDIQGLLNRLLPYQDQIRAGYLNPATPMGNYNSTLVDFTFAGTRTESELIKKSARLPDQHLVESQRTYQDTFTDYPVTSTLPATDDLDARIKAALERSQATYSSFRKEEAPYSSVTVTRKDAETLKSSVPHNVARTSAENYSNVPLTSSYYPPATNYQYTVSQYQPPTQPTAGENLGLYSSYRVSNPVPQYDNLDPRVSGRNPETEKLLKSSVTQNVDYRPVETYSADPFRSQYNTGYLSTNYYPGTLTTPLNPTYGSGTYGGVNTGVSSSQQVNSEKRAEAETVLRSSAPVSTYAYVSVDPGQGGNNANVSANAYPYSSTTLQNSYNTTYGGNLGLYGNTQSGQDRYVEPYTQTGGVSNRAVGGATTVAEYGGIGGFTDHVNKISFGEHRY